MSKTRFSFAKREHYIAFHDGDPCIPCAGMGKIEYEICDLCKDKREPDPKCEKCGGKAVIKIADPKTCETCKGKKHGESRFPGFGFIMTSKTTKEKERIIAEARKLKGEDTTSEQKVDGVVVVMKQAVERYTGLTPKIVQKLAPDWVSDAAVATMTEQLAAEGKTEFPYDEDLLTDLAEKSYTFVLNGLDKVIEGMGAMLTETSQQKNEQSSGVSTVTPGEV